MKISRLTDASARVLTGFGALALLVMTLWTVVDVITRHALSKPLRGSIDLVESTLVLVVFLALPQCFKLEQQVTVDVVDQFAGPRTVNFLKLIASLATLLFLGLLGYTGIRPLLDAWQFGDMKPDLPVPIYSLLGVIELALLASVAVMIAKVITQLRRVGTREVLP